MVTSIAFDASDEVFAPAIDTYGPHGVVIYISNNDPSTACILMVPTLVWSN